MKLTRGIIGSVAATEFTDDMQKVYDVLLRTVKEIHYGEKVIDRNRNVANPAAELSELMGEENAAGSTELADHIISLVGDLEFTHFVMIEGKAKEKNQSEAFRKMMEANKGPSE